MLLGSSDLSSPIHSGSLLPLQNAPLTDPKCKQTNVASFVDVQELGHLLCCAGLVRQQRKTLQCQSGDELEQHKQRWKKHVAAASQLREALQKATKGVSEYVKSQDKLSEKKRKQSIIKREKEEKEATKRRVLAATSALSSSHINEAALFKLDVLLEKKSETTVLTQPPSGAGMLNLAWIMRGHTEVKQWMSKPRVQLCLATFGGSYKKNASFRDPAALGQVQQPLITGKGSSGTSDASILNPKTGPKF